MKEKSPWKLPNRYELGYARVLTAITKEMLRQIEGLSDPPAIIHKLQSLSQSMRYKEYCYQLSYKFITNMNDAIKGKWRKAARVNGKGREIYESLVTELGNTVLGLEIANQVSRNAELIVTLPRDIAREVTAYIGEEAFSGRRSTEMAEEIKELFFPPKTKARAILIARTEVSKAQCALTKARAESLGLNWYIWRTSDDARVRSSHEIMSDVLVKWSHPPNPEGLKGEGQIRENYHAGNIYNCRCYSEPVINIDQIKFPHKVYYQEKIKIMTKSEFSKIT